MASRSTATHAAGISCSIGGRYPLQGLSYRGSTWISNLGDTLARSQVMPPLQIQLRKRVIPKHLCLSDVPSKYIDTGMARLLLN